MYGWIASMWKGNRVVPPSVCIIIMISFYFSDNWHNPWQNLYPLPLMWSIWHDSIKTWSWPGYAGEIKQPTKPAKETAIKQLLKNLCLPIIAAGRHVNCFGFFFFFQSIPHIFSIHFDILHFFKIFCSGSWQVIYANPATIHFSFFIHRGIRIFSMFGFLLLVTFVNYFLHWFAIVWVKKRNSKSLIFDLFSTGLCFDPGPFWSR